MKTSVPNVTSLEDIRWRIAKLIDIAFDTYKATGDVTPVEQTVALAREFYETELKPRGNAGKLSWVYVNKFASIMEKAEASVRKAKELQQVETEGK